LAGEYTGLDSIRSVYSPTDINLDSFEITLHRLFHVSIIPTIKFPGLARGARVRPCAVSIEWAREALMSDGYEVYVSLTQSSRLAHLGCWVHARRRFVEAEAALPKATCSPVNPATQFVAAIGERYEIEARAREVSTDYRSAPGPAPYQYVQVIGTGDPFRLSSREPWCCGGDADGAQSRGGSI
jgi:hypothetical protein